VKEAVLKKMRTNVHEPYSVADGDVRIGAVLVEVDERTGKATRIEPLSSRCRPTPSSPSRAATDVGATPPRRTGS